MLKINNTKFLYSFKHSFQAQSANQIFASQNNLDDQLKKLFLQVGQGTNLISKEKQSQAISLKEKIVICAFRPGQDECDCYLMASLNSVRAYFALRGQLPPSWMNNEDGGRSYVFQLMRSAHPLFKERLQKNGQVINGFTSMVPSIILRHLNIPHAYHQMIIPVNNIDGSQSIYLKEDSFLNFLTETMEGKISVLDSAFEHIGFSMHSVTCVGLRRGRDLDKFLQFLSKQEHYSFSNPQNSVKLNQLIEMKDIEKFAKRDLGYFLIYDQASAKVMEVPINCIFDYKRIKSLSAITLDSSFGSSESSKSIEKAQWEDLDKAYYNS